MELLQVDIELAMMMHLYAKQQPKRVLEIGSWDGGTLQQWLTGQPDILVAIDENHRNAAAYDEWVPPGTDLVLGTGLSQSPEMVELMQEYAPYDWVFIDGDHSEPACEADVQNTLPLMEKGGVMLLHDITEEETSTQPSGPMRCFQRLQKDHESMSFVCGQKFPWTAGIGVVFI